MRGYLERRSGLGDLGPSRGTLTVMVAAFTLALLSGAPVLAEETPNGAGIVFEGCPDLDWGPYGKDIKALVQKAWVIPKAAKRGEPGASKLHFYINDDGTVEDLTVIAQSGPKQLTQAASSAILAASPLPPLPCRDMPDDRVGITWTFLYNMDAEQLRRWQTKHAGGPPGDRQATR